MTKKPKQPEKKVNSAIGVRKEVRDRFSAFCNRNGFVIGIAAEQALAAWMRERVRMGEGK